MADKPSHNTTRGGDDALLEQDLLEQDAPSRYVVGIDLGTTNSAVSYVDTSQEPGDTPRDARRVQPFAIAQLVDFGQIERRETLPSFHYQPPAAETGGGETGGGETGGGRLRLPWSTDDPQFAVGCFARDHGALTPGRQVVSAKSWLCHTGVDRTADLLPWQAAAEVDRLSPVEVSARYLRHVRDAWDAAHPTERLADQDIVLTLPASFDEVARELTVSAGKAAGLPRIVLIEEPQAAFYAWIDAHRDTWQDKVEPGQKILVCDIGGGTTDFTLIRVREGEEGRVQFHRVAVGDHLILGGDNLDLALAQHLESRIGQQQALSPRQWDALLGNCRMLKEQLLGDDGPDSITVNLSGGGSRLIGGGIQIPVTRDEVHKVLLDGFFPQVALDERPQDKASGFREFGLPYAADPAVSRYLAAFLTAHRHAGDDPGSPDPADHDPADHDQAHPDQAHSDPTRPDPTRPDPARPDPARPDIVLFNGGLFGAQTVRRRLLSLLNHWFRTPDQPDWTPRILANDRLDLAVSRGAAYYGMVRRGEGVRIAAGLARSYYIGVDSDPPVAVCLVPGSAEPGQQFVVREPQFDLVVRQPVEFPLYVSSVRLADAAGQVITVDREQMTSLPPIRTALQTRRKSDPTRVAVELHAGITEIGTLELWCGESAGERRWRLQFDVRSATRTDIAARATAGEQQGVIDEEIWERFEQELRATFGDAGRAGGAGRVGGPGEAGGSNPEQLVKRLVAVAQMDRREWPPTLLRRIWDTLMQLEAGRRRSAVHEARWLNLLGYSLRPGFGIAVDDWRVAETWRNVQNRLNHPASACRTESLILWRRVGGGLSPGQQRAVAEPLLAPVRALHRRQETGKGRSAETAISPHESAEMFRLLGSLELLPGTIKVEMGNLILDLLPKRKLQPVRPALYWSLARIGARIPVYGPLNTVVPADVAGRWIERLIDLRDDDPHAAFTLMQLSRRAGDRYRDIPDTLRADIVDWMQHRETADHLIHLVQQGGQLDRREQGQVFGEALPIGLRIR